MTTPSEKGKAVTNRVEVDRLRDELAIALDGTIVISNGRTTLWAPDPQRTSADKDYAIDTLDGIAALAREHAKGWRMRFDIQPDGTAFASATEIRGQYREVYAESGPLIDVATALLLAVVKAKGGKV